MNTENNGIVIKKPTDTNDNEQLAIFWMDKISELFGKGSNFVVSIIFSYELKGKPGTHEYKIAQAIDMYAVADPEGKKRKYAVDERSVLFILPSIEDSAKYTVITEFDNDEMIGIDSEEVDNHVQSYLIVPFKNLTSITFREVSSAVA
ncbi:MAG: hypothetical protein WDN09_04115 [bacterium]